MKQYKNQSEFQRGWIILFVTIIGLCLSVGSVLVYTFGIFAKPLSISFSSNRGQTSLSVAFVSLMVAISSPISGKFVDRFGAKKVIMISLVALSICLVLISKTEPPIWHLWVLYGLAGIAGTGSTPVAYSRVVSNWFDKHRGLALGIASTGIGLGSFVMPSLAQYLVESYGWRQTFVYFAGGCLLIALPLVAIFLKNMPEDEKYTPSLSSQSEKATLNPLFKQDMSIKEVLQTRTFWTLCLIFFFISTSCVGALAHLSPMLTDQGFTPRNAALVTSLFGAATIVGRVGNGLLIDRFFAPYVAAVIFAGSAIGLGIFWYGSTGNLIYLGSILIGLAIGAESDIMPFMVSRYFGIKFMGMLYGIIFGAYTVGAAAGPFLFGLGFDKTGSYKIPYAFAFGITLIAVLMTLTLGKYQQPSRDKKDS